jgi:hypothetical protein
MKVICWNNTLQIKAENEQDSCWLQQWVEDLGSKEILSNYIELEVGEFDSDGKLEILDSFFNLIDYKKNRENDGKYVFVETNHEEHSGTDTGKIVGINFKTYPD